MMAAASADAVAALAIKMSENARETMFRQLALWIKRATQYDEPHPAWDSAREAAIWSLLYAQRLSDVAGQVEQYERIDRQIRQTHASRLREMTLPR